MRVLKPRKKEARRILVPVELQASLRGVHELIQISLRDPEVNLDFGDAIQVGSVCGGRYGKTNRPYVLTYYPEVDMERGRWFLTLSNFEIEDIADGRQTELLMHCCTSADCRSKFREPDTHCFFCDYIDDPRYGTFSFPRALQVLRDRGISSLSEASTRRDLVATFGSPERSGGGTIHETLGFIRPWVTYRRDDCQLRFDFDAGDCIQTVTILERDWEPGKRSG